MGVVGKVWPHMSYKCALNELAGSLTDSRIFNNNNNNSLGVQTPVTTMNYETCLYVFLVFL